MPIEGSNMSTDQELIQLRFEAGKLEYPIVTLVLVLQTTLVATVAVILVGILLMKDSFEMLPLAILSTITAALTVYFLNYLCK